MNKLRLTKQGDMMNSIVMTKKLLHTIFAMGVMISPIMASAEDAVTFANKIESVNFVSLSGDKLEVHFKTTTALKSAPNGFLQNNPDRIAIDFTKVGNGLNKNTILSDHKNLKSISFAQSEDRTRVVFNLKNKVSYLSTLKGDETIVTLQPLVLTTIEDPKMIGGKAADESAVIPGSPTVKNVDFIRGRNGEGRVTIDLSSEKSAVSVSQKSNMIVLDLINVNVPESLQRRLNVTNFNTPVLHVDTKKLGKNTRITVEPKGNWEQSSYQTGKQFILDVRAVVDDPNKLASGSKPGFSGEKLSLNFQNIEVRAVLQVIADFSGLNIITSDTVTGNISLRLKDVKWDHALDIITRNKGLTIQKNDNVLLIAPADEVAAKEKQALESLRNIEDLETLRTEVFTLNYMKADDLRNILTDAKQRILSKRGTAVIDARTNTLFVQDTPKFIEQVHAIIARTDVSVKQVMIESRIVIADNTYSKALGARFGVTQTSRFGSTRGTIGGRIGNVPTSFSNDTLTQGASSGTAQPTIAGSQGLLTSSDGLPSLMSNLPVAQAFGSIAYSLLNLPAGILLNLELNAMESDQKGKVISSPRITTSNQHKAKIASGTEIPFQQASSSGAANVAFKSAVLSLEVTPQITPNNKIIMELDVKKDSVGQVFNGVPSIDTQSVQTQLMVGNGETAVLGGIYEQTERNAVDKVPFFGDLPIMGNAFKRKTKQSDKTELLIFITPRILDEELSIQ